jgi:hypothetical protein
VLVGVEFHPLARHRLRLVDRLANARHPQHACELEQELVAGGLDEREMEVAVGLEARVHASARPPLAHERGSHRPQRRLGAVERREPRRSRLEQQARLVGRPHAAAVEVRDAGAAVGAHLDQPLGRKAPQRLAHRRARDPQLDREILLVHARPPCQRARHDALADRRVGEVDDARDRERLLLLARRSAGGRHAGQHRSRAR